MFTTHTHTVHASSKVSFRSGACSLKSAVFARRTWKKSMGSSSSRGRMSVVKANQTASDEIEMLQKMLELAKRRKENESKEDLSVSAGGKSNGSGYEGTIKRRILEAIFESNRSFYIEDFSRGVAWFWSQIGFYATLFPKTTLKAYSKHAWLCYVMVRV